MQVEEVIELLEEAADEVDSIDAVEFPIHNQKMQILMNQALTKLREAPEPTSLGNTIRNIAKSIPNETNRNIVNQAANRLDRWWRYIGELKVHLKQLQAENDKLIEQAKL